MFTPETLTDIRAAFPILSRKHNGNPLVFLDNAAGTQVPRQCIEGFVRYLSESNSNTHNPYVTGVETDAVIANAHAAMADFINAPDGASVILGPNMTTLTFALSRALSASWQPGDEIILTRLDHDGNFSPWHLAARDRGVTVRVVDINTDDCTLVVDDFERYLGPRTRLVAVGGASNMVGTINPLKQIIGMARAAGALSFVDAVAYAPHVSIDVQALGCDFLACSPYKFWGPHLGALWGRRELLDALPAYKVRPAGNELPGKFQTGTQSHEAWAGLIGTFDYLEWLSTRVPASTAKLRSARASRFRAVMDAMQAYERGLCEQLIRGIQAIPGSKVYGITDPARFEWRAPTVGFRVRKGAPEHISTTLGERGILVQHGNYYAQNLSERLGLEDGGGVIRASITHYNTAAEIDRLLEALD
ncbi:MAG: cysteine desulfurase-like protein [Thermoflexales bacterium]|nr:cysteine desulfurase-like protein [Thermoflexales bacterium]